MNIEIVRCKNCIHWSDYPASMANPEWHDCLMKGLKSRADDFCSFGDMKSSISVVHCKDCQNYEMSRNEANGFCYELNVPMAPWEFCSRGETRCRATNSVLASGYKTIGFDGRAEDCPLKELPAVGAVPVRHGHWNWFDGVYYSVCNYKLQSTGIPSCCPNCGAKMEGCNETD